VREFNFEVKEIFSSVRSAPQAQISNTFIFNNQALTPTNYF